MRFRPDTACGRCYQPVFRDVAQDDLRRQRVVVAHADQRFLHHVLRSRRLDAGQRLMFAQRRRAAAGPTGGCRPGTVWSIRSSDCRHRWRPAWWPVQRRSGQWRWMNSSCCSSAERQGCRHGISSEGSVPARDHRQGIPKFLAASGSNPADKLPPASAKPGCYRSADGPGDGDLAVLRRQRLCVTAASSRASRPRRWPASLNSQAA